MLLSPGRGLLYEERRPHSMTKEERRQRAERARLEREREAQIEALRQIRDDPQATPGERLEAVKLLLELE